MKFKKLLAVILTMLSATTVAVGFSGCKDNETENALPPQPPGSIQYFDEFEDLKNYYEYDFHKTNDEQFYLLNPGYTDEHPFVKLRTYAIKCEDLDNKSKRLIDPTIKEDLNIFDEDLGTIMDVNKDTGLPVLSFSIYVTFLPLQKDFTKDYRFTFEYEPNTNNETWDSKIKIYDSRTIIAECLYYKYADISQEWLENYFINNLI